MLGCHLPRALPPALLGAAQGEEEGPGVPCIAHSLEKVRFEKGVPVFDLIGVLPAPFLSPLEISEVARFFHAFTAKGMPFGADRKLAKPCSFTESSLTRTVSFLPERSVSEDTDWVPVSFPPLWLCVLGQQK